MNPQDPLAALHPLREPLPVGWWPPAPGWWLLLALLVLVLCLVVRMLWRRRRARAYRRQALAQLEALQAQYAREADSNAYLTAVNALLKSVALAAYPRRDVAARNGQGWLSFLNAGAGAREPFPEAFVGGIYRREPAAVDVEQVHRAARNWIRRHEVAR